MQKIGQAGCINFVMNNDPKHQFKTQQNKSTLSPRVLPSPFPPLPFRAYLVLVLVRTPYHINFQFVLTAVPDQTILSTSQRRKHSNIETNNTTKTKVTTTRPNESRQHTCPLNPRVVVTPQKLSNVTTPTSTSPTNIPEASSNSHSSSGGDSSAPPMGAATGETVGAGATVGADWGAAVGTSVIPTAFPATISTDLEEVSF